MTGVDEFEKRWEAAARRPIAAEMTFDGDVLVLGAQTRLAKVGAALDEPRLIALLAAAHGRPVIASPLRHIQRAMEKKQEDDLVMALIHLALSGLAKLSEPKADAHRLFLADELMSEGVAPLDLMKRLDLDLRSLGEGLDKYSEDQPRVPAGNSKGGQWTHEGTLADGGAPGAVSGATERARPADSTRIELAADNSQTCADYIAANCQARILRVFPGQFLTQTLQEMLDAAKQGDPAARRAKKLFLERGEYQK